MQGRIAIVCMLNNNLGNNLTNYALYSYITQLGYEVVLIDIPYDNAYYKYIRKNGAVECFIQTPYKVGTLFNASDKWELYKNVNKYDAYIVASDQLWRDDFVIYTDFFSLLDWVPSYKYKLSYSTSIGIDSYAIEERDDYHIAFLLDRFQKISVRETSAKKLLYSKWGINSKVVLDPVFLCNIENYNCLAAKGTDRIIKNKYIGMYFLDVDGEKEKVGKLLAEKFFKGNYIAMTERIHKTVLSEYLIYTLEPYVEEWLAMMKNAELIITDSFHGMCFSIIFKKPFYIIFNKESKRGYSRFEDFLQELELRDRLIEDYTKFDINSVKKYEIDYRKVCDKLNLMKEDSIKWIESALMEINTFYGKEDEYDCYLRTEFSKQNQIKRQNQLIAMQSKTIRKIIEKQNLNSKEPVYVGWGMGSCFKDNINTILKKCDMKYICDNNSEWWGKSVLHSIKCISPEELYSMYNIFVIIIVDNIMAVAEIENELEIMGIDKFERYDVWLNQ